MQTYLVGGAVRDALLGLECTDKDFVVVGSSTQEMLDLGFVQVGKDFPVFLHPQTHEEYALARTEKKTGRGYTGFHTHTQNVTLKEDLSRRDLTINAMAQDEEGNIIDYFGGQEDLQHGLLRHTSDAFREDPVRVLRIARFGAKLLPFGFKVAHSTHKLLKQMSASGELEHLTAERVFAELEKALNYQYPSAFFHILNAVDAYAILFHLQQEHHKHHNDFTFLDNLDYSPHIKCALWLSYYKLEEVRALMQHLKAPKKYTELCTLVVKFQTVVQNFAKISAEEVLDFFVKSDSLRRKERFYNALIVWQLRGFDTINITNIWNTLQNIAFNTKVDDGVTQLHQERITAIKNYVG